MKRIVHEGYEASSVIRLPGGKLLALVVLSKTKRDARRELANEVRRLRHRVQPIAKILPGETYFIGGNKITNRDKKKAIFVGLA